MISFFMQLFSMYVHEGNECGSSVSGTLAVSLQRIMRLKLQCFYDLVTEQW